jgi:hypothetical protein
MLSKGFWVLPGVVILRNQHFGTTCLSHLQDLKMGHTSSPETLVSYLKITMPGKNPQKPLDNIITPAQAFNHTHSHPMFLFSAI